MYCTEEWRKHAQSLTNCNFNGQVQTANKNIFHKADISRDISRATT